MSYIRDYTVWEETAASTNPAANVEFPVHATDDVLLMMLAVDGVNIPALPSTASIINSTSSVA